MEDNTSSTPSEAEENYLSTPETLQLLASGHREMAEMVVKASKESGSKYWDSSMDDKMAVARYMEGMRKADEHLIEMLIKQGAAAKGRFENFLLQADAYYPEVHKKLFASIYMPHENSTAKDGQ
ncbi:unnamed protein product [Zymoseptoria tritici ST99CH_1A5]|uniref:Uncharacterized protein n=1 Tax=Zymoseptoria tritici ST99CH_1A5 TaxID=1276529 RepID=A0A1Y6M2B3_ZYMTR|nr:unnamed protein product [Zymoseptoria tritici ST99CH_3D1]SMY29848.1 unnamed protein product [Zymoseptoria tritici ST99CH_1A5]